MSEPKPMLAATPLAAGNAEYLEELYERYLAEPQSVPPAMRDYFARLGGGSDVAHGPVIAEVAARARVKGNGRAGAAPAAAGDGSAAKQALVSRLIQIYMNRGHLVADIDPLGLMKRPRPRVLD